MTVSSTRPHGQPKETADDDRARFRTEVAEYQTEYVCLRHPCMTSGADPGYRGPRESGAACPTGVVSSASASALARIDPGLLARKDPVGLTPQAS
jgi:hypothetical protein